MQAMASSKALILSSVLISLPLLLVFLLLPRFRCPAPAISQQFVLEEEKQSVGVTSADLKWVASQMQNARLGDPPKTAEDWSRMRKGINPRTREEQLFDLRRYASIQISSTRINSFTKIIDRYHGISHYDQNEATNHTKFPCPGELLVEQHHSNYGEPWAGGRDVFEFIATASSLKKQHRVLEVGCGTLRVGLHFIRYLAAGNYYCVEKDPISLMAAFAYELPSQGLDLVYASAAFLHMPDTLVWSGLERLIPKLKSGGKLFVSHNIKFCTRLGGDECKRRLAKLKLSYLGKKTHDSLLFNHYEIWHQFVKL